MRGMALENVYMDMYIPWYVYMYVSVDMDAHIRLPAAFLCFSPSLLLFSF